MSQPIGTPSRRRSEQKRRSSFFPLLGSLDGIFLTILHDDDDLIQRRWCRCIHWRSGHSSSSRGFRYCFPREHFAHHCRRHLRRIVDPKRPTPMGFICNRTDLTTRMRRSPTSIWAHLAAARHLSFHGPGKDVKRSLKERMQMKETVEAIPEWNCSVECSRSFARGDEPFQYFNNYRLANSGLAPRGSAIETRHLAEIVLMGTVPVIKERSRFLHVTYMDVPGIIADKCVVGDMDYVLRNAFRIVRM